MNDFIEPTETRHYASVVFWWTKEKLHDTEYRMMIDRRINAKITALALKYAIEQDIRASYQWEGYCLFGHDKQQVEKAIAELAQAVSKFKGIITLEEASR